MKPDSSGEKTQTETVQITQPQAKKNGIKDKLPLLIVLILLILLVPLGGYFLFNEVSKAKITPTPSVSPEPSVETETSPTKYPSPTSTSINLDKSFTSAKFSDLSFSGYKLMYPSDWTLSEERDGSVPISTVTLTKQGYTLKIFQAATGGAMCIYEGDMPEGPASDYRTNKFTDLTTGFGTLRQTESSNNGKVGYAYCQKNTSDSSFSQPTSVGHMSVTTGVAAPDPKILEEIEAIVESIELVK